VLLVGRRESSLNAARERLTGEGHETLVLDLNEVDRVGTEIARITPRIGRVYGLCHAAGVVETHPLAATTWDLVQRLMTLNLTAGLELARAVCRREVMDPDGGSLVFVSSIYGRVGVPGQTAYSASKGAVASAVRAMAIELARRRIRVNTVSPGFVATPMTDTALEVLSPEQVVAIKERHPLGTGTPADVARAVVFLLAPENGWITGVDLAVDGGYSAQ
jgi:NAD(P)-dependent dehydrogenase (short-subunit alcohol dehydrogenase family)